MHNSCYFSNIAHIFRMPFPKLEGQKLSGAGFLCRVVFSLPPASAFAKPDFLWKFALKLVVGQGNKKEWEVDPVSQAYITWFGHSCFQVELAGSSIVLDPYGVGSVPGLRLPDLNADEVHISHNHTDHNAAQRVLCSGRPLQFSTREVAGDHDHHDGAHRGKNKILVIEGEGLRIVHLGDQGRLLTQEQIDAIGRPDLLMLPVGGYFTIDAAEAHQVMEQLQPAVTIPMHYRDCRVGFRMLDTLDAFLDTDLPVKRAEERRFVLQQDMPRQIVLPVLVQ